MRHPALLLGSLILLSSVAMAEDQAAPAVDRKAQLKELEAKQRPLREAALKDDAALTKLKADADEARKAYETAADAKLAANPEYQALKAQIDELRALIKKEKDAAKEKDAKPKQ
jgi:predicted  nucleic acid-binding Zn-ribbon protein